MVFEEILEGLLALMHQPGDVPVFDLIVLRFVPPKPIKNPEEKACYN